VSSVLPFAQPEDSQHGVLDGSEELPRTRRQRLSREMLGGTVGGSRRGEATGSR